jgi:hypothetical protein
MPGGSSERKEHMKQRSFVSLVTLALALAAGTASAASRAVVTIDNDLIRPSTLQMSKDDVLEFVNYSSASMMLVFLEPRDQPDRVRCHLTELAGAEKMAAQLSGWSPDHRLTQMVPPGTVVSVCSLTPGRYVFVTKRIGLDGRAPAEQLGTKGTITVVEPGTHATRRDGRE